MATHFKPYTHFFVYLLIICYGWSLGKGLVCELYLSIAHTASVMNSQLYGTAEHHHMQDIAQLKLGQLQAKLAAEEDLPPQQKSIQAPEKQTVYSNQLETSSPAFALEYVANYFWRRIVKSPIRQLPTPPPKLT